MLFNSWEFLLFFPIVTVGYFFLRSVGYRVAWLLVASCVFYAAFVPKYLLVLFAIIGVDYWAGLAMENRRQQTRRLILMASLVANLGLLFLFKYYGFFSQNLEALARVVGYSWSLPLLSWGLPLGLSFHTFQAMAYTIEVYRGKQKAERNLAIYALYVLFYPQLVAGPIERPGNL